MLSYLKRNKHKFYWFIFFIVLLYLFFPYKNIPTIRRKKINKLDYNQRIQKNIFQIWGTKELPDRFKWIVDKLKRQNPEYNYYLYDDKDMEDFVKREYPEYWESYNSINQEYIVAKGDFFRYMVLYHYGGVYFDIKSGCRVPLREIIKENDSFITTSWQKFGFTIDNHIQWCIISERGHPILKLVLETIDRKIKNYNPERDEVGQVGVLKLTGPWMYQKVVLKNFLKYKNKMTYYKNLIDGRLVYSYLDKNNFDYISCLLYGASNGIVGYCNHSSSNKKKRYRDQKKSIIKK